MCLIVCKLFNTLFFHHIHFFFVILPALFQNMFYLGYCNYREKFGEKEITSKEQSKCSHIKTHLPYSRGIISTPARWQVITIQGSNNDHKTFEPHTHVHQY